MESQYQLILTGKTTTKEAINLFDQLAPINLGFMLGIWKGSEVKTGHRMDGLLEVCGWYGKWFIDIDSVHPLLFYTSGKKELYAVNPDWIPLKLNFPKTYLLEKAMNIVKPILQTKKPKAHLKIMTYRGKSSATMVYNSKPIKDHFRKVDENTVLGLMELKGEQKPYFFILKRDTNDIKIQLPSL